MAITVKSIPLGPVSANTYILTDVATNECAVIDAGDFNGTLKKELDGKNVKFILLTHGHFDHILGVHDLKAYTNAEVMIHKLDSECLSNPKRSLAEWGGCEQKCVSADRLLQDGDEIMLGETKIKVMHTPGHTPGGVCYIIESERTIFTGDTLFSLTAGRTDLVGGDDFMLISSLKKIAGLDGDYKLYPGHNRSTTLDYERTHNRYLRRLV